jgi:hypothetical protein
MSRWLLGFPLRITFHTTAGIAAAHDRKHSAARCLVHTVGIQVLSVFAGACIGWHGIEVERRPFAQHRLLTTLRLLLLLLLLLPSAANLCRAPPAMTCLASLTQVPHL